MREVKECEQGQLGQAVIQVRHGPAVAIRAPVNQNMQVLKA